MTILKFDWKNYSVSILSKLKIRKILVFNCTKKTLIQNLNSKRDVLNNFERTIFYK